MKDSLDAAINAICAAERELQRSRNELLALDPRTLTPRTLQPLSRIDELEIGLEDGE